MLIGFPLLSFIRFFNSLVPGDKNTLEVAGRGSGKNLFREEKAIINVIMSVLRTLRNDRPNFHPVDMSLHRLPV